MPEKLDHFPDRSRTRYDWDTLLSGDVWRLTEGEDFTSKLTTFRMNAKTQAEKRDGRVRTSLERGENGGPDKLVIQFYKDEVRS